MSFKADSTKIKRWREERHWSQEHLADLAGIGVRTLQRIETGEAASPDSLKALAAYQVDVMALSVDPEAEAERIATRRKAKSRAALRLSFWIHLASFAIGAAVFIGISVGVGGERFAMLWPLIWWTVGLIGHGVAVVIVELASHYEQAYGTEE